MSRIQPHPLLEEFLKTQPKGLDWSDYESRLKAQDNILDADHK
jgi:hypothetical protein